MTEVLELRRQLAISGRVVEAGSRRPLRGARVEIREGSGAFRDKVKLHARMHGAGWESRAERIDRTRAAADGHFHFLDLPDGEYTLHASLPGAGTRYDTVEQQVTVTRAPDGRIDYAVVELAVSATTLSGRITAADGEPVMMAEVRIGGSGESTVTAADGRYAVAPLEIGGRTVSVSARGFQPVTQPVTLVASGAAQALDVTLTPSA
jgi:hypothetical protein